MRLKYLARELSKHDIEVAVLTALPNYPTGRIFPSYRSRLWARETLANVPVSRTWVYASADRSTLFRTLKHTPVYPRLPFADREAARRWVGRFVSWYNSEHHHSAIRYVTPDERHSGADVAILARRHALYQHARSQKPERWAHNTRNWTPLGTVVLNPEPRNRDVETA